MGANPELLLLRAASPAGHFPSLLSRYGELATVCRAQF